MTSEETTVVDDETAETTDEVENDDVAAAEAKTDVDDIPDDNSDDAADDTAAPTVRRSTNWSEVLAYGVLPAVALILALAAGYLKYVDNSARENQTARVESVQAAAASTVAILSYAPDKIDQQLNDARNLLTGQFRDSYSSLVNDVVIPGAKQKQIAAVATVPKVGSVSADPRHAVAMVFVNQTVVVGGGAPTDTASSVRVTLDKVGDKWLISGFDPI